METYKPAEIVPDSGELIEVGPRGGKVEDGRKLVIERGEKVPPTSEAGNVFRYFVISADRKQPIELEFQDCGLLIGVIRAAEVL